MAASKNSQKNFSKFTITLKTSTMLRTFYMKGQRAYRKALEWGWEPQMEALNDTLQELNDTQREGFLMGWQSDAYAHELSLDLSVEGTGHASTEPFNRGDRTRLPWMQQ